MICRALAASGQADSVDSNVDAVEEVCQSFPASTEHKGETNRNAVRSYGAPASGPAVS